MKEISQNPRAIRDNKKIKTFISNIPTSGKHFVALVGDNRHKNVRVRDTSPIDILGKPGSVKKKKKRKNSGSVTSQASGERVSRASRTKVKTLIMRISEDGP